MVEKRFEVVWNESTRKQIRKIYDYISQDSILNARKVVLEIMNAVDELQFNPERFGEDKFKKMNDGSYRYFELFSYRIAFKIHNKQVRILRIRSTYQEPKEY